MIVKLKYVEEHLSCSNYRYHSKNGFTYKELSANDSILEEKTFLNCIILLVEGAFDYALNEVDTITLTANKMLCVPKGSKLTLHFTKPSKMFLLMFNQPLSVCDKQVFSSYSGYYSADDDVSKPLTIVQPILDFLSLLQCYIENKMNCIHLHSIKEQEFFLLLRAFYTKEDTAAFLWPVIRHLSEFRYFVETNVSKVNTMKELIERSHYSNAVFYRKFKEEYGDIAPQKWMLQQRKKSILEIASHPNMTVGMLMEQLNIKSTSTLKRICQELFECTPAQLITKLSIKLN